MIRPTPHLEMMSEMQQPTWMFTTERHPPRPTIGKKYTTGYVHQLTTVQTCACWILALITGSCSWAVAAARPTKSSYTTYRKKHMEMAQQIQRGVRSPVTTSSP